MKAMEGSHGSSLDTLRSCVCCPDCLNCGHVGRGPHHCEIHLSPQLSRRLTSVEWLRMPPILLKEPPLKPRHEIFHVDRILVPEGQGTPRTHKIIAVLPAYNAEA